MWHLFIPRMTFTATFLWRERWNFSGKEIFRRLFTLKVLKYNVKRQLTFALRHTENLFITCFVNNFTKFAKYIWKQRWQVFKDDWFVFWRSWYEMLSNLSILQIEREAYLSKDLKFRQKYCKSIYFLNQN